MKTEYRDYGLEQRYKNGRTRYGTDLGGMVPGWYCALASGMSDDGPDGPFHTQTEALNHLRTRFENEYCPPIVLVVRRGRLYRAEGVQP
jgi:hypothetical protein